MKKICILTCGGTITMKKNENDTLVPLLKGDVLLKKIPYLSQIANISVNEVINIDSTNVEPNFWTKLAFIIRDNYQKYDGFVITHGTDTMAYTASAVSFALSNLNKPIIFTGSQKTIDDRPTDAESNLINAVLISTYDIAGVLIVFGSKILLGSRSTKISESNLDAFDSPMVSPLGMISLGIELYNFPKKIKKINPLICKADFNKDVVIVVVAPGLNSLFLEKMLNECEGIILLAYGPGNIPQSLLTLLKKARELRKPVIIVSQCKKGSTKMHLYEVGSQALDCGAIPGNDMTIESAVTKLMWLLGQTKNINIIKKAFQKNYFGEVTV